MLRRTLLARGATASVLLLAALGCNQTPPLEVVPPVAVPPVDVPPIGEPPAAPNGLGVFELPDGLFPAEGSVGDMTLSARGDTVVALGLGACLGKARARCLSGAPAVHRGTSLHMVNALAGPSLTWPEITSGGTTYFQHLSQGGEWELWRLARTGDELERVAVGSLRPDPTMQRTSDGSVILATDDAVFRLSDASVERIGELSSGNVSVLDGAGDAHTSYLIARTADTAWIHVLGEGITPRRVAEGVSVREVGRESTTANYFCVERSDGPVLIESTPEGERFGRFEGSCTSIDIVFDAHDELWLAAATNAALSQRELWHWAAGQELERQNFQANGVLQVAPIDGGWALLDHAGLHVRRNEEWSTAVEFLVPTGGVLRSNDGQFGAVWHDAERQVLVAARGGLEFDITEHPLSVTSRGATLSLAWLDAAGFWFAASDAAGERNLFRADDDGLLLIEEVGIPHTSFDGPMGRLILTDHGLLALRGSELEMVDASLQRLDELGNGWMIGGGDDGRFIAHWDGDWTVHSAPQPSLQTFIAGGVLHFIHGDPGDQTLLFADDSALELAVEGAENLVAFADVGVRVTAAGSQSLCTHHLGALHCAPLPEGARVTQAHLNEGRLYALGYDDESERAIMIVTEP